MKKCSICNKNLAVIYTNKVENGQSKMVGICMECAQKMDISVMDELMKQMDMTSKDVENLSNQIQELLGGHDFEDMENNPFMQMFNPFDDDDEEEEYEQPLQSAEQTEQESADSDNSQQESGFGDGIFQNIKKKVTKSRNNDNKKDKKRKNLNKFGENLNKKAIDGKIDKVIGRQEEIDRLMHILSRRNKNNAILVGEPGVGKTAIAEGLATKIVAKEVPEKLQGAEIYLLDLTAIVAGTQFRGQFEARMKAIINEAQTSGNIILVIDEVHSIMGAGEVQGGVMNAANILKPALAKGEIQIIGATTLEEYRKHIEKDAALERRFQSIMVEEPSIEASIAILEGIKSYYEDFHNVVISKQIVEEAVRLADRYVTDRYLPDKAIDVIDEAGAKVNLKNILVADWKKLKLKHREIVELKEDASANDQFEQAAEYKAEELRLANEITEIEKQSLSPDMTIEDIAEVIESWTKIPVTQITEAEAKKLLKLEERLHQRVIGQNDAVSALARSVRRNRAGFRKRQKPSSFIFVGPTGVGKTELAKSLAVELFGSEEAMIRLDMSEFMEKHTVSKLIGAPPGYVGYDQGGQLTERIRRKPYSVILMDEIEKAHPDVFNMLLQILEDGRLTDSQGRTVFFENAVIIMTSNAGSSLKSSGIGFSSDEKAKRKEVLFNALREYFRPEFINRIDEIIAFEHLTEDDMLAIVELQLKDVYRDAEEKGIKIEIDQEAKEFLAKEGYSKTYGARPLRRKIQSLIEDEISDMYLRGEVQENSGFLTISFNPELIALTINAN